MVETYWHEALSANSQTLTLLDHNPTAPPMAALAFWRYKIIDFPSGMAQEFVCALAYDTAVGENPFYKQLAIRVGWRRDSLPPAVLIRMAPAMIIFPMNRLVGRRRFPSGKR